VARDSLLERIDAVLRPLAFASRDEGAQASRIRDLEKSVAGACDRVLARALPSDLRRLFEAIRSDFSEELEEDAKRAAIARAERRLEPLTLPGWTEGLLARPLSALPGVGPKRAAALEKRGLRSLGDLLFHLPTRYEDRRELVLIGQLEVGRRATFIAEVRSSETTTSHARGRHRRILQAVVADETGSILLKWFRSADVLESQLKKGNWILVTGDVKRFRFSKELVHPEIEPIDAPGDAPGEGEPPAAAARDSDSLRQIVADYTAPEGVNPRTLRRLIQQTVEQYADLVPSHLPDSLAKRRGLPPVGAALAVVHGPPGDGDVETYRQFQSSAHERLVLEELYLLELGLALRRSEADRLPGIAIGGSDAEANADRAGLPFELTSAQARVVDEILADLRRSHPMNRLVQGDVGSGKTAVALLAAARVARAGHQVALMAPTELLAEQHVRTLRGMCDRAGEALGLRIALLTASVPKAEADGIRRAAEAGEVDLVVGTHALVQGDVRFRSLGLSIVDEQHRFGVLQRAALASCNATGLHPHSLVMTATPIPRTLSMTLYGDLDLSLIDELPPGREPARTLLLRDGEGQRITDMVRETVGRGEQVYIVYPLVEESEKIDLRSAIESAERIRRAFSEVHVDLVHGRLSSDERGAAMDRFASGETMILVSTTVIEVGVDVPAATLMVVEHAERFGLAQLHQLRGRVGRGERPGTCLLVARKSSERGEARLRAMLETHDGFRIADADLQIRGPGEFLGTRQSGHFADLRVADLLRDVALVAVAREEARRVVERDPGLTQSPETRAAVESRWGERLELSRIG